MYKQGNCCENSRRDPTSMAFSSNNTIMAVNFWDGIQLWDVSRMKLLRKLHTNRDSDYMWGESLVFLSDNKFIALKLRGCLFQR